MIKFISIDNMEPLLQVDATSEQRARELPKPAYDGQDNLPLAQGMDNYAVGSTEKFYHSYDVSLNLYTVENAKVLIRPAAHGTGVIAGGSMRAVLEAAGVTDVLAKNLGSANPQNVVKATYKALSLLREPVQVARQRNINLKKVFNG